MASLFGHIAVSTAIGYAFFPRQIRPATLLLAGFCAFAPDLDVLAFRFGISYGSPWGHRGWTHSLAFTLVFGTLMAWFFRSLAKRNGLSTAGVYLRDGSQPISSRRATYGLMMWCALSAMTHPLLDMMTNGGRGCALWWPFSTERIFFPFRPVQVSPMSVSDFISDWGLMVLASEAMWIGLPALVFAGLAIGIRKIQGQGVVSKG